LIIGSDVLSKQCPYQIAFTIIKKPAAPIYGVAGFYVFLCFFGAEIMENHQNNLWSQSAQKYFWLEEPEIIKKIFNGFLPVRENETFAFLLSRISDLPEHILFFTAIIQKWIGILQKLKQRS